MRSLHHRTGAKWGPFRRTNRRVTFPPSMHAHAMLTLDYEIITRLVSATSSCIYLTNDIRTQIRDSFERDCGGGFDRSTYETRAPVDERTKDNASSTRFGKRECSSGEHACVSRAITIYDRSGERNENGPRTPPLLSQQP